VSGKGLDVEDLRSRTWWKDGVEVRALRHCKSIWLLATVLAVAGQPLAAAQTADGKRSPAEALQYEIEIRQHERLIRARKAEGAELAPFVSDGCSGGLSSGWAFFSATFPALAENHGSHPPWESCCVAHDRLYHAGGASDATAAQSYGARLAADKELRLCIIDIGRVRQPELTAEYGLRSQQVSRLYNAVAEVMYRAVRLGGAPCSSLPWRWGFGWPDCDQ
jgi:hypothetical protein